MWSGKGKPEFHRPRQTTYGGLRTRLGVEAWLAELDAVAAQVVAAAREVHDVLGPGLVEVAYQRALAVELQERGVGYAQEAQLELSYKGQRLGVPFRVDFVCGDLLVELKAVPFVGYRERAQLRHYLQLAGAARGLLVNFGRPTLDVERVVARPHGPDAPTPPA